MSEEVKKRVRRSPEEIAAEIDVKIAAHKDAIKKLVCPLKKLLKNSV